MSWGLESGRLSGLSPRAILASLDFFITFLYTIPVSLYLLIYLSEYYICLQLLKLVESSIWLKPVKH